MICKTNIGWVYIENSIYLKIEVKNVLKLMKYINKIKKINVYKKFLVLKDMKNIKIIIDYGNELLTKKNDIKLKNLINIDYEVIEWIFYIHNKKEKYKNIELGVINVSIKKWLDRINYFEFDSLKVKWFKNTMEIEYETKNIFLIYLYIDTLKSISEHNSEKIIIIINNKEVQWEIGNIVEIKKLLEENNRCKIINKEDFTYYVDILNDNESLFIFKSQTM